MPIYGKNSLELEDLMKLLQGHRDSRSTQGILSRGQNIYNSTSLAAQSGGGPQYGRPKKNKGIENSLQEAIKRRLKNTNRSSYGY